MNKRKVSLLLSLLLVLGMFLFGCESNIDFLDEDDGNNLLVNFIDVGQGDSTLIEFPNGETCLIDGGPRSSSEDLIDFLKTKKIEKIDYLIGTHPHEDHIGGLPEVLKNFKVEKVYLPNKTANTVIFEDLLKEIKKNDLKIIVGKSGLNIADKDGIKFDIIAPNNENYSNTNNYSIVTKIVYKDFSLLVTGDAERESELEMVEKGYDLKSKVLKVGHHGSSTSSTSEFLEKVNPDYSIISLGKDNSYGHPHKEAIERLEQINTKILRTDELGTIVIKTDGENIEILNKIENDKTVLEGKYFIGNKNTKVFHSKDCNSLPNKENQITFKSEEEALKEGYKPHGKCIK
ncbi:MBL fold metallo-hydrolase [Tissierella sp. MSJ-40]|uniref:MBL fold metallo-hydrolase n=1 Tax=Tissierella simiarum TaxID=2841534 RepID=A0ABS6E9R1_9FIRM|nr:MBL fold metallo-hydrolase [Tissierella simiarum]MBU5439670.1 MBL fold metallo-hydrolase [Tissierella simiarum]